MQIKIKNHSEHELPKYAKPGDAGMDLRADLSQDEDQIEGTMCIPRWIIKPGGRVLVPTGIFLELPRGYEAQIRPRSGLALKHGVTVLNTPGTIDSGYRDQVKVLLINLSSEPFTIEHGDRIAQMVVAAHETVIWLEAEVLTTTERGVGGYGSTGKN